MRKLTALLLTIGVIGGLTLVAAPAGAEVDGRVAAKTSKFCKAIRDFNIPQLTDDPTAREQAAVTAKQLKKISKKAKGKVRNAVRTLADSFEEIADGDSLTDVFDASYATASATFVTATLKCLIGDTQLPDISLPDISLPGD